jgi:23S rRNA pseudouridine1911/1915/1917 synthase
VNRLSFTVPHSASGERLDRALAELASLTRSQAQRAIEEGRVFLDTLPCRKPGHPLRGGESLAIDIPPPAPLEAHAENIALSVLFEDADLIVLDKAAGMVVHPAVGHDSGTLVNALLHHCGDLSGIGGTLRPGIVHRLDKGTSGVMVVAKSERGHLGLSALFANHDLERRYLAIVRGAPPDAITYDTLHGRDPNDRKRFSSKVREGKRAITQVSTRERFLGAALVEARLETGRTHQVRVHLSDHGFPLLGDDAYGRSPKPALLKEISQQLGRPALHAARLGFVHPVTGQSLNFETPPPADFANALQRLRNQKQSVAP